MKYITLSFWGLIFVLISCTRIYEDKSFQLKDLGFSIMLPANSTIQYNSPSHSGDIPNYQIFYNDGNSGHSNVEATLIKEKNYHLTSLKHLIQEVKNGGGTILEEYDYINGFVGCSYEKDGNRLFQFIKNDYENNTYVIVPNEVYNNRHKYLSIILRAIESIELIQLEGV